MTLELQAPKILQLMVLCMDDVGKRLALLEKVGNAVDQGLGETLVHKVDISSYKDGLPVQGQSITPPT